MSGFVPIATGTDLGVVKVDGTTIDIAGDGTISVDASVTGAAPNLELTDGTHDLTHVSKVTVEHMNLGGTADDATLSPALASTISPGIVQPDDSTIEIDVDGIISAPAQLELTDGTADLTHVTKITTTGLTLGGTAAAATLAVNEASLTELGISRPDGATIDISPEGVLSVDASVLDAAPNLELTDGVADLTHVSKITVSHMDVGGTAAAATLAPQLATTVNPGIMQPDGTTLYVNEAGIENAVTATAATLGIVQPDGTTIDVSSEGVISVPTATTSELGVVKADGSSILISGAGELSAAPLDLSDGTHAVTPTRAITVAHMTVGGTSPDATLAPDIATTGAPGIVQPDGTTIEVAGDGTISAVNQGVDVTDGTDSVAAATAIDFAGATVSGSGGSATVTPNVATTTEVGVVKADGSSILVAGDGTISAVNQGIGVTVDGVTIDQATQLQFDDATLSGTSPHIRVTPTIASDTQLGVVKVDGTSVHAAVDGTISVDTGTFLPAGAEGDILVYTGGAWTPLPAGTANDVLTSDGEDVSYLPARMAIATGGTIRGTRHELDLTATSGDIVLTPTDDSVGDVTHVDIDLSAAVKAALGIGDVSYISTLVANTLCLNLWNGSGNNAPPTGWQNPSFDDAAWSGATDKGAQAGMVDAHDLWYGSAAASTTQQVLFRTAALLPLGKISSATVLYDFPLTSHGIYVNGTLLSGTSGTNPSHFNNLGAPLSIDPALLIPGGQNVIAAYADSPDGTGGVGYAMELAASYGATTGQSQGLPVGHEGDLLYFHNGAWTRLPIGASGDVLTSDGNDPGWAAPSGGGGGGGSGGGLAVIAETVVPSSGAANVTFSSIPSDFRDLVLVINGRTDASGTAFIVLLQFNGDTGVSYTYVATTLAGGASGATGTSATGIRAGVVPGTSVAADIFDGTTIDIHDYAATTHYKSVHYVGSRTDGVSSPQTEVGAGTWENTAAINALTVFPGTGNWVENTVITLYGRGGSGGGSSGATLAVDDGTTTVTGVDHIVLSGATVSGATGTADVLIPQPIIFAIELTGGGTTIDFTGIPNTARHLRIEGIVRSDSTSGSTGIGWALRLNNISAGGYVVTEQLLVPGDTAAHFYGATGQAQLSLGGDESSPVAGFGGLPTDSDTGHVIGFVLDIPYYGNYGAYKSVIMQGAGAGNAGQNQVQVAGQAQDSSFKSAAVSRVTFIAESGSFHSDSHITLYGYN